MAGPQLTELVGSTIAVIELSLGRLSLRTEQGHSLCVENQVELDISKEFDTDSDTPAKITEVSENADVVKITFDGGELRILMADKNFRGPEAFLFSMPDGIGFINRGDE